MLLPARAEYVINTSEYEDIRARLEDAFEEDAGRFENSPHCAGLHPNKAACRQLPRNSQRVWNDQVMLKRTPLNAVHRAAGRQNGRFRRLGHAGPVLRAHRRAQRRAQGRRPVRRQPHGRNRNPRARKPCKLVDYVTTNAVAEAEDRPGAVFRACSTNTADSSTTSWCTRSRTIIISCASTRPTRTRISSTSAAHNRFDAEVEFAERPLCAARDPGPEGAARRCRS